VFFKLPTSVHDEMVYETFTYLRNFFACGL